MVQYMSGSKEWEAHRRKLAEEANKRRAAKAESRRGSGGRLLAKAPDGDTLCPPLVEKTKTAAAKEAGVSTTQMARAKTIKTHHPEMAEKVRKGEMTLAAAEREHRKTLPSVNCGQARRGTVRYWSRVERPPH